MLLDLQVLLHTHIWSSWTVRHQFFFHWNKGWHDHFCFHMLTSAGWTIQQGTFILSSVYRNKRCNDFYLFPQRSQSAFSLLDNDLPGLIEDSPQTLQKEGAGSAWKSVDRLDNAGKILKDSTSMLNSQL